MQTSAAVGENGLVTGYASLFGEVDRNSDVVLPGAFKATLDKRPASDVKFLFQHDVAEPIGSWLDIYEDARGLRVVGRLIAGVARARECFALIRSGAIDGLSIGFRTTKARKPVRATVRELMQIDLWEISLVTFPMLPGARLTALSRDDAAPRLVDRLNSAAQLFSSPSTRI